MPAIKLNECSMKAENLYMQSDVGTTSTLARYKTLKHCTVAVFGPDLQISH